METLLVRPGAPATPRGSESTRNRCARLAIASATLLLVAVLAPRPAAAAPGCWEGDVCAPARAVGPCDERCTTRYCIDGQCASVATCAVPCETGGGCPTLLLGNFRFTPDGATESECVYPTGGACGALVVRPTGLSGEAGCLARGADASGWLEGDCDGDGVTNVVEGPGALCEPQAYVGAAGTVIPTCDATMCAPGSCASIGPLGGSACDASGAAAYACADALDCPTHPLTSVTACVPIAEPGGTTLGACHYGDVCLGDVVACFDFEGADPDRWLPSAFERGDCDGDAIANREDAMDCGLEISTWADAPRRSLAMACPDASPCLGAACSALGFCVPPDTIGVACEPGAPRGAEDCRTVLGTTARCVPAGSSDEDEIGVCVPVGPMDATCERRARACFAPGADPTESYLRGDCDGDGVPNGEDDAVCSAESADAGAVFDTGVGGGSDVGGAGPSGSGACTCRAGSGGASAAVAVASVGLLGLIRHARRRRVRARG